MSFEDMWTNFAQKQKKSDKSKIEQLILSRFVKTGWWFVKSIQRFVNFDFSNFVKNAKIVFENDRKNTFFFQMHNV